MPKSRGRKKKKHPKIGRGSSSPRSGKNGFQKAVPGTIKMKTFLCEFVPLEGTINDRIRFLQKIGIESKKSFPEKYSAIKDWFLRYDQLQLLAKSFYYFTTSRAGYDEEALTGTFEFQPFYQELLQAFALTMPRSTNTNFFSDEMKKFRDDFKELGELVKKNYFDFPESVDSEESLASYLLRTEIMLDTTAVRNWSYNHLMKEVTMDLASMIREPFLDHFGLTPTTFLEVVYKMTDEVNGRVNSHGSKIADVLRQKSYLRMMDTYEANFPVSKTRVDKKKEIWEGLDKDLERLRYMFLLHSDYRLPHLLTFDYSTFKEYTKDKISVDQLKKIFQLISFSFGELEDFNIEHFLLGNPVHQKPFINVDDDSIFSSLWMIMSHLSLGILEDLCSLDRKLLKKYDDARGIYLENKIMELLSSSFPMAKIYRGSMFPGVDGKIYENDLLVIIENFALVIEAKAGRVTPPAKRGAQERLFRTLRELIETPSDQALRFVDYLKSHNGELNLAVKKGPGNKIDTSKVKYYIPLGVTLSHLGMMGSNLKKLNVAKVLDKGIEDLALSVSLTDLKVVFELLPLASEKIHYLQRRRETEANIDYMGDELDLLAWYLDTGFELGNPENDPVMYNMVLKSKELDNYIIGKARGLKVNKPRLKRSAWWQNLLNLMEERRVTNWLECSYILNNFPYQSQVGFEKKIKRLENQMRKGKAELPHNWIYMVNPDPMRRFVVAGYCYYERYLDSRHEIVQEILDHKAIEGANGKLVIGINVDRPKYPYNMLACSLKSDLFDNKFLRMKKDP
jgi:hypothetical protein